MNSEERLNNKLKYSRRLNRIIKQVKKSGIKIEVVGIKPQPEEYHSPASNIATGDMLGTGIIGGLDLDITTPL